MEDDGGGGLLGIPIRILSGLTVAKSSSPESRSVREKQDALAPPIPLFLERSRTALLNKERDALREVYHSSRDDSDGAHVEEARMPMRRHGRKPMTRPNPDTGYGAVFSEVKHVGRMRQYHSLGVIVDGEQYAVARVDGTSVGHTLLRSHGRSRADETEHTMATRERFQLGRILSAATDNQLRPEGPGSRTGLGFPLYTKESGEASEWQLRQDAYPATDLNESASLSSGILRVDDREDAAFDMSTLDRNDVFVGLEDDGRLQAAHARMRSSMRRQEGAFLNSAKAHRDMRDCHHVLLLEDIFVDQRGVTRLPQAPRMHVPDSFGRNPYHDYEKDPFRRQGMHFEKVELNMAYQEISRREEKHLVRLGAMVESRQQEVARESAKLVTRARLAAGEGLRKTFVSAHHAKKDSKEKERVDGASEQTGSNSASNKARVVGDVRRHVYGWRPSQSVCKLVHVEEPVVRLSMEVTTGVRDCPEKQSWTEVLEYGKAHMYLALSGSTRLQPSDFMNQQPCHGSTDLSVHSWHDGRATSWLEGDENMDEEEENRNKVQDAEAHISGCVDEVEDRPPYQSALQLVWESVFAGGGKSCADQLVQPNSVGLSTTRQLSGMDRDGHAQGRKSPVHAAAVQAHVEDSKAGRACESPKPVKTSRRWRAVDFFTD